MITYSIAMREKNPFYTVLILGGMLAFVVALLLFDFGTDGSPVLESIMDFGHFPLFGVVSLIIVWILNKRRWPVYDHKHYALSISAVVALGVMTELLQHTFTSDRLFSVRDVLNDTLGALTFLVLAYPSSRYPMGKIHRYKALAVVVIVLATVPVHIAIIDSWEMYRSFPVLNSFETRFEMGRVSGNDSRYTQSFKHAVHGVCALETRLSPGEYPGIALEELYGDWRGYDRFSFDAHLAGSKPLQITVRVNDALHNQHYADRFNKQFVLLPGANTVVIDLREVGKAPRTRVMDMSRITNICIFSYRLKEPRTLFFDNFRLEKGSIQKR